MASTGKRDTFPIGPYDAKGRDGRFTLAAARERSARLSELYREGHRDLRQHLYDVELERLIGIPNDVINECLNHIKQGITGIYVHDRREAEQARAFDALGAKLAAIARQRSQAVERKHSRCSGLLTLRKNEVRIAHHLSMVNESLQDPCITGSSFRAPT